jgi:cellulose synthase/poly-beta-1,6-N-acetylglucosamine synthase-like glycosyltransferase
MHDSYQLLRLKAHEKNKCKAKMNVWYNILLYAVWFISTYYVVVLALIMFFGKDSLYEHKKFKSRDNKYVSIIVPAFNEEKKIKHTILSLKKISYEKLEFIIVNDGSSDGTARIIKESIAGDKRFRFIDNPKNMGKAASLNEGIYVAKGEFIATMDADSVVERKIFQKVLPYFSDENTAAVTVSVLVKKPKGLLQKMFEIEYIIGLSLFLKVFSMINSVFVTPGPFSIYRKSVLAELKGFDEDSITEDTEIAYRIQKNHYKIANCLEAKVYTIIPPTFKKLCIQRKRWYSGAIFTLRKHKDMLLNSKYGMFGFFVFFNYMLIFFGLALFLSSIYLSFSRLATELWHYQYTNFNILQRIFDLKFDLLTTSRASVLGILSLLFTLTILFIGLRMTRSKMMKMKIGIIEYPLLFFFYQIFWLISAVAIIRGKQIKWR